MPRISRASRRPRRRWSQDEKRKIVHEFEKSGLSRHAFAKERNIVETSLSRWLRQLGGEPGEIGFVEVTDLVADRDPADFQYELSFGAGRMLRLRRGFDAREVEVLVAALER